jgi:hypothetical protein
MGKKYFKGPKNGAKVWYRELVKNERFTEIPLLNSFLLEKKILENLSLK